MKTKMLTFGDDVKFLKKHTDVVVLADRTGNAQVAVVPAYQGRIMTSTATGGKGLSFGWINHELIGSGTVQPHINVYGGEDRFWIGPEGGQFSIFFAEGVPFDLAHWFTPAALDTEPFAVVKKRRDQIICQRRFQLTNYSGTAFDLTVTRTVRLLSANQVQTKLGLKPKRAVKVVAFESVNALKNTGAHAWQKKTGLLSIWMLGMLNAAPATTVVVPFKPGAKAKLGPIVNDSYFGKVPKQRLVVKERVMFFSADAKFRSKIGVGPHRCLPVLGSYDAVKQVLTIVQFNQPAGVTDYVNSMWKLQRQPFSGDVVNSYNDGPASPGGKQLGQFYELETSSPALALKPKQSAVHIHRTFHLQGDEADLDPIARALLGVGIEEIKTTLRQ
jgi:hypothetical protein